MDQEIKSFIKIWLTAITSLLYCYYISSRVTKGLKRLISLLPILYLFITLPLDLHSFHLGGPTILFLVWLATSKLLLFSFDLPPLSPPPPNNPFHFISIACLPIKIRSNPYQKGPTTHLGPRVSTSSRPFPMPIKVILLGLVVKAYEYRPFLNSHVTLLLYCLHMYLGIEIVLAFCALPARALLGFELEPQFNDPYLTTSLQDFWGRRWNLMVSSILKPTAYEPMRLLTAPLLGPQWAQMAAYVWAFTVSGLVHETIFYYLSRARPTWEVTAFFIVHGFCTATEVAVKRWVRGRWQPHRAMSSGLTLGFLLVSGNWLFFPQIMRNGVHEKAIGEYAIMVDFVKNLVSVDFFKNLVSK